MRPRVVRPTGDQVGGASDSGDRRDTSGHLVPPDLTLIANEFLSVGHEPAEQISERERQLLNRFENHLVSLLTHELKTPFLGVMNGISLIEFEMESNPSLAVLEKTMGWAHLKRGIGRLNQTLVALQDLIALHSGDLRLQLSELHWVEYVEEWSRGMRFQNLMKKEASDEVLLDPKRFSFAFESCIGAFESRLAISRQQLGVEIDQSDSSYRLRLFVAKELLSEDGMTAWNQQWSEFSVATQGGIYAPGSAFSGKILSDDFLVRADSQKMTSDWVIADPIIRAHGGHMQSFSDDLRLGLEIRIPILNSLGGLRALLETRLKSLGLESGHPTRLWIAISRSLPSVELQRSCQEILEKGNATERISLFDLTDIDCSVFLAEVPVRDVTKVEALLSSGGLKAADWSWLDASTSIDGILSQFIRSE